MSFKQWEMDIWNEPTSYKKGAAYLGAGFTIKSVNEDFIGALKRLTPKQVKPFGAITTFHLGRRVNYRWWFGLDR